MVSNSKKQLHHLKKVRNKAQVQQESVGNFNGVRPFVLVPVDTTHEGLRHPSA